MKVFLVIYAAGQIISAESPPDMTISSCEVSVAFMELEQSLILLDEVAKPSAETAQKADAVRDLTFACEQR